MHFMFVYPNTAKTKHPQMGLLTLGSYLMEQGVDASICDLSFSEEAKYTQNTLLHLQKHKPDVVAISLRTLEFEQSKDMLREIRKQHPNTLLIAGGPHPTYSPDEVAPYVDYGIIGDGEDPCLDIATLLAAGHSTKIAELPNLFYNQDDVLIVNPNRPLFDISKSPLPKYELFDERHYVDHCFLRLVPGATVCGVFEGSRGCPYKCTYCSNSTLMEMNRDGGKWRREKSGVQIRKEIDHFKSLYGMDMIYFIDEVIMTSDRRTAELQESLQDLQTRFIFMERPELIREERVKHMKAAGAYSCSIGIESGGEEFRKLLLKRNMPDKKIRESYDLMHKHDIRTHAFIMMGMPDQDESVMQESIRLLQEIQPSSAQATTFYPLPATELYNLALEKNLFDPKVRPSNYYSLSSLDFSDAHKQKIQMYANMVNLEMWRDTPIRNFTVWLCIHIPALFPLVDRYMNSPTGYIRYLSIRKMTAKQFLAKIWEKITARGD